MDQREPLVRPVAPVAKEQWENLDHEASLDRLDLRVIPVFLDSLA